MNRLLLVLLPALALAASPAGEKAFEDFVQRFSKGYNGVEKAKRLGIFLENFAFIQKENAKGTNTYELGVTEFADLTAAEFESEHFGFKMPEKVWGELPNLGTHEFKGEALAASVDWRTKGAVTPVKNQGQCGSCWAFSTTGSLEGANQIANGKLVSFSEQQLVDCAGSYGNNGCGGGLMDNGFKYVEASNLCTEDSYPYTAKNGNCHASGCSVGLKKGSVSGYKDVARDSEQSLMSAIQQGPVSIAIEADKSVFQLYKSGVLSSMCGSRLDHGVLAVGYGTENGKDYWLVKNSWGATWGDEGYVKLLRGKGGSGECGLLQSASYPVIKGSTVVV